MQKKLPNIGIEHFVTLLTPCLCREVSYSFMPTEVSSELESVDVKPKNVILAQQTLPKDCQK